jgi:salicylate hydroxylase
VNSNLCTTLIDISAGLAGLMAARVLRENHNVTILERFNGNSEIGAAISFGPTATKIVEQFGLDRKDIGSFQWAETRMYDKEGNLTKSFPMSQFASHTGSDFLINHRVNLWNGLYRLATAPSAELGIGGQPAVVRWDADAIDVDCESGNVTIARGERIASDLVIGKS